MARRFRPFRTQTSATSKASPEVVYDTIADLRAHLEWSGERATFRRHGGLASDTVHHRDGLPTRRKRGELWEAHFSHRYDIEPDGAGTKIVYTERVERANYTPYWLHPLVRPIFRPLVNRADRKQLRNLGRLAEERSNG
jgi:hypothetical protein